MYGTIGILEPMMVVEIEEVSNQACRLIVKSVLVNWLLITHSWARQANGQNWGGNRMISKLFETVLANRIYHVVCRLSQLSFCVQLVGHLQYFLIRIS